MLSLVPETSASANSAISANIYGAPGRTRTGTFVRISDFESDASTNFTTGALLAKNAIDYHVITVKHLCCPQKYLNMSRKSNKFENILLNSGINMVLGLGKKKKVEGEATEENTEAETAAPAAEAAEKPAESGEASAEGTAEGAAPKKSKKKLIIIIVAAVVLIGGGAGLFLSGALGGKKADKTAGNEDPLLKDQILYHDMDEFLVNLNNPGNQVSFLKAVITLELPNQLSLNEVQDKMPRIRDIFQVYLRELRSSDLQGSAGLQRLRAELLLRVNSIMEKGKVNNVLFKEIIIQ